MAAQGLQVQLTEQSLHTLVAVAHLELQMLVQVGLVVVVMEKLHQVLAVAAQLIQAVAAGAVVLLLGLAAQEDQA